MSLDGLNIHVLPNTAVVQEVPSLLTGYAGSRPPGPMIYWLGSSGGTPWDRLGGALPVNTNTPPLLRPYSVLPHEEKKKHVNQLFRHLSPLFPNHTILPLCEETYCTCVHVYQWKRIAGVWSSGQRGWTWR